MELETATYKIKRFCNGCQRMTRMKIPMGRKIIFGISCSNCKAFIVEKKDE